jgi:hypothetical protein
VKQSKVGGHRQALLMRWILALLAVLPSVALVTVDETLENLNMGSISFLKIDTEGHELQVLNGSRRTLRNSPRVLVLYENSEYDGVRDFFVEIGWKMLTVGQDGQVLTNETELRRAYNRLPADRITRSAMAFRRRRLRNS